MPQQRKPIRRNSKARALASPLFRQRVVAPRRGKGSYRRKGRIDRRRDDA